METGPDTGTYEVLRDRLAAQAVELARRAEALDTLRTEEFGARRLALTGTGRLHSERPSLPRDVVAVGDRLLFGRHAGPPPADGRTEPGDVLALHDRELNPLPADAVPGLLDDADFRHEFAALHRYYRQARLLRLRPVEGRLLAVFQTGENPADIRVLRWELAPDGGSARFLDARGERDHTVPPEQDLTWTEAAREDHVSGRRPYAAIGDGIHVSTVGGFLTVGYGHGSGARIETEETGTGGGSGAADADELYREPVSDPLQSLADAEIAHAAVGPLVLLRVRPYKEEQRRYLVVDPLTRQVVRLDGIGAACRRLPGDGGVVFPGGYYLASGEWKTFDAVDTDGFGFEAALRAPNGEDVLFAFHAPQDGGRDLLLSYSTLRQEFAAPLVCKGHALFGDGTLAVLRADGDDAAEPGRVHTVQTWASPYVSDAFEAGPGGAAQDAGPLARIGNRDLVGGISACLAVARSAAPAHGEPSAERYRALAAACERTADSHPWLGAPETGDLHTPLQELAGTAAQVLAEFETVRDLTRQAAGELDAAAAGLAAVVRRVRGDEPRPAAAWVEGLTALRAAQGRLLGCAETRYADTARAAELAAEAEAELAAFGLRAVESLREEGAFADQHREIEELIAAGREAGTAAEAAAVADRIGALDQGLRTVTEVIGALEAGDAAVRTAVLERVSEVAGGLNRARATAEARRRTLLASESQAEFAAEFALLGQSLTAALAAGDTPQQCDTQHARLLAKIEDLERRFTESPDFLADLDTKRAELNDAFAARKQTLADARARRTEQLVGSAERTLGTLARRAAELADSQELAAFFTSDPMAEAVRRTAGALRESGESARAQELEDRLSTARQEAARALRDRGELYLDGGSVLRLGRHRFAVNTQPLDLTLVPDGDGLALTLTGTDYRAPVTDPELLAERALGERLLPSESAEVYRAEHLAARLLDEHGPEALGAAEDLPGLVRQAARDAYDEGYERGVHDHDAVLVLRTLLELYEGAGALRHEPGARAAAQLFWAHGAAPARRDAWTRRAVSLARADETFGPVSAHTGLRDELAAALASFGREWPAAAGTGIRPEAAADYLLHELAGSPDGFVLSGAARTLLEKFRHTVDPDLHDGYLADLAALDTLAERHQLATAWLSSYARSTGSDPTPGDLAEAVAAQLCPELARYDGDAPLTRTTTGLLGAHPRLRDGDLTVRIDEFLARTAAFRTEAVPAFRAHQRRRARLVARERDRLRLADHRPQALPGFVRSRLIDEVWLPLIGENLAKQLGTDTGAGTLGGLLLLLSPPGYGKTTLLEYVAERLGLLLVKVNGPALGSEVTSLDPAQAPHATARQELEKLNLALKAGSNTLLYVDDIQHTAPEFLEKFIPLCDGTRRVEGVWEGAPHTYDLRGKRFAVCMAGNPYTGSGSRFRIPDMLANRADVWNLGEVLTGKQDAFALSFVENALTSHPVLAPLAARPRADVELLVALAEGAAEARADRLSHPCPPAELDRILAVLRHVLAVRETVLAVNRAYIASAGQTDATRTEPPFRLQGSYRTMNKIVQRVQPVMNDAELGALVEDHFAAEAQTLTADAEANLLKLAELRGVLTGDRADRWAEIKRGYVRTQALGDTDTDPMARAVAALGLLADRVAAVEAALRQPPAARAPERE
ncbi:DNA repair ATPase [Streptomyces sp. NPDC007083]|uniref:DNA repair ATPase n=1 Tax=Streptomyces sp. NPDC007083 TaxID=3156913 RepID=UPI0033D204A5